MKNIQKIHIKANISRSTFLDFGKYLHERRERRWNLRAREASGTKQERDQTRRKSKEKKTGAKRNH